VRYKQPLSVTTAYTRIPQGTLYMLPGHGCRLIPMGNVLSKLKISSISTFLAKSGNNRPDGKPSNIPCDTKYSCLVLHTIIHN
jgi:hypothetical protein